MIHPHTTGLFSLASQVQFSNAIILITEISDAQVSRKDVFFTHKYSIVNMSPTVAAYGSF